MSLTHFAGRQSIDKADLTEVLKRFYPEITTKQVQELVGKGAVTLNKLKAFMVNSPLQADIDERAFTLLDSTGSGAVDVKQVAQLLKDMINFELDPEDMRLFKRVCKAGSDGKITLESFKSIGRPD